ncbi:cytoskeletal protein RodZ [Scopulibacillus daqui]|uniref:Cytoskeletal protein RodZ n=1 Tax=Scopulibacillus daqui TaxID=1469162 RepID=A0ABS2PWV5_9BACL|nr:helix-turn-helix domain-containing protein [Scopulibacillus daqui]MBM7644411.1 cytoskeletal protein RodZ [Scopulibacillus daqui]
MSELGTALKQARQEKGMTLEDIESKTKIQKRYLQSIEEGEFDQLPGNFYTRAFIKNYAETVGLDPNVLLNEYGHEIPKSSQEPSQVILPSRTRQSAGLSFKSAKRRQTDSQFNSLLPKIIIIVVLLLILIGIWLLAQHFKSSDKSAVTNHTSPDVVYKKDENNSGKSAADEKKQKDQKAKSETKDNKKDQKSKKDKAHEKQHLSMDKSQGNTSYFTLSGTNKFNVEISAKPKKQTWIEARDGGQSGKKFAYGIAQNGSKENKFKFDASNTEKLYIKAGNAPDTEIKVNGKTLELPNKSTTTQTIYITFKKA